MQRQIKTKFNLLGVNEIIFVFSYAVIVNDISNEEKKRKTPKK
jgi:hypothetical protein